MTEVVEAIDADMARMQECLDGMASDAREIGAMLADFARRRAQARFDGPVA